MENSSSRFNIQKESGKSGNSAKTEFGVIQEVLATKFWSEQHKIGRTIKALLSLIGCRKGKRAGNGVMKHLQ